ncbi:MAG: ComEC/Rec2 family competence protein [Candidatus Omnitrophica bacterium]|nr:ComEC/Rec2 family competence protein [Candidatus Omnitrophota bacterium]
MKTPFVALTVFYCLGIILAEFIPANFWLIMAVGAIIFFAASLSKAKNYIFLVLLSFLVLFLGILSLKNSYRLPKCHISNFVYYKNNSFYSLSGSIDSQPVLNNNRLWFSFRTQEIQVNKLKWHCCGQVLVKIDFPQELNYGDNLTLLGNLTRPYNFNSTRQGYKDFLARQGIHLIMRIKDPRQIIRRSGFGGSRLIGASFWLRSKMEEVVNHNLPDLPASILSAMILGQRRNIPWVVNDSMIKSGTVHILVVSGFNVGIVAFSINLLLKILRIARKGRIILTIICLLAYCLITGSSNPVIRATVMGIVFLAAYLLKRDPDIYNSLAGAALFILIINPRQLFDVGFQLSFISVLAIVYLYPRLKALTHLENYKNKVWKFIGEGFLVSFSAWLGTLWIIVFNFRIIAPVTILANILIVPLATVITLCGFTLVLSGLIYPHLASLFSAPASALITLLLNINCAVIRLPLAYFYL